MYRLLIVDDEEIIVEGLAEILSNVSDLELDVYKAYSGSEALARLHRTQIDIVVTDIRMPGIDGLQLMERILETWPHCRIIFLTGYDEFDYVYRAIRNPGVRYLLKTEEHEKVVAAVQEAAVEIEKDIHIGDLLQQATKRLNQAKGLFQRDYLLHVLAGDDRAVVDEEQFEQFGIPLLPDQPVYLLVGSIRNLPADRSYRDRLQDWYALRLVADRHLDARVRVTHVMDELNRFLLLIQPQQEDDGVPAFLRGALERMQEACSTSLRMSVSFATTTAPHPWHRLAYQYERLCGLLRYRAGVGAEILRFDDGLEMSEPCDPRHSFLPESGEAGESYQKAVQRVGTLANYLETGQQESYLTGLEECLAPLRETVSKNSHGASELYYVLAVSLLGHINRWGLAAELAFRIGIGSLMRVDAHVSWEEAANYLTQLSVEIFRLRMDDERNHTDCTIERIHTYIDGHLGEDLSLARLAEIVYLNPSYLSRLYKQATGQNLSVTIDQARIASAKALMAQGTLRIHEVGTQVGYETATSFTRFFRKWTGVTPQEYLESMGKRR